MNIFKILSSNDGSINEPNVSSFLAYLLDPNENHGLGSKFLEYFLSDFVLEHKKIFNDLIYNDRVRDLSKNSPYNIRVEAEVSVILPVHDKKRTRDIDILVEFYDTRSNNNIPRFSFCIENKIKDAAIEREGNQLFEEISGLINYYRQQLENPKESSMLLPNLALIFLTPQQTKRAESEFSKAVSKLSSEFEDKIPCKHLFWGVDDNDNLRISSLLTRILEDEAYGRIEPIYEYTKHTIKSFLTFIRCDFQSYKEEKNATYERQKYGKTVIQYFNEIYEALDFDKDISTADVKQMVKKKVLEESGKNLHKVTLDAHMSLTTVNDRVRKNHVNNPLKKDRNLFFYPEEINKKIVRKLNLSNPPKNIMIYWRDENQPENLASSLLTNYYPEN